MNMDRPEWMTVSCERHERGAPVMCRRAGARGFTLVEIMVVIAIITILAGLVLFAGSRVFGANKPTQCKAQLTMLADAIRRYSEAWPAWKWTSGSMSQLVPVSKKGYPDWCAARLFRLTSNPPPYQGPFNPPSDPCWFAGSTAGNRGLTYDLFDPNNPLPAGVPSTGECDSNSNQDRQIHTSIECLAYSLTSRSNGGPFLREDQFNSVRMAEDDDEVYPSLTPPPGRPVELLARREITDPWGRPLRYFWVYQSTAATNPSGWSAITTADPFNPQYRYTVNGPVRVATAVVVESAGPDGRFGNRWVDQVQFQSDTEEAKDNLWELIQ